MKKMEKENNTNKINIHQIFWYFILFSIIGLIIETVYGYVTMGILESRKGLIWGPFCPVYGVGATILILLLNKVDKKNYIKLFFYGFLIGSIVEYLLSYGLEAIFGTKFWDYTYTNQDINGRICIPYSLFWGVLAILLMKFIKPLLDKIIDKIKSKAKTSVEIVIFIFLAVDVLVTIWGINTYETRASNLYYNKEIKKSSIQIVQKIEDEYFTNERMKKTFPNLRTKDANGNGIFVRDILK